MDGHWQEFHTLAGASDEWVTGFIGLALAHGDDESRDAAQRAWHWLEGSRPAETGWGYSRAVPVDADSTAWALQLAHAVAPHAEQTAKAVNLLTAHQHASGALATYARDGAIRQYTALPAAVSFAGWCGAHAEVTAVAAAIDFSGRSRALEYLRSAQLQDGSWKSYWWQHREYGVSLAVSALANGGPADAVRCTRAAEWAAVQCQRTERSPFDLAACLLIGVHGGWSSDAIAAAATRLVELQREDGSWEPSALLRIPPPFITNPDGFANWIFGAGGGASIQRDETALYTTAFVSRVLGRSTLARL